MDKIETICADFLYAAYRLIDPADETIESIETVRKANSALAKHVLFFSNYLRDDPTFIFEQRAPIQTMLAKASSYIENRRIDDLIELCKGKPLYDRGNTFYFLSRAFQLKGYSNIAFIFARKFYDIDKSDSSINQVISVYCKRYADDCQIRPEEMVANPNNLSVYASSLKYLYQNNHPLDYHSAAFSSFQKFPLTKRSDSSAVSLIYLIGALYDIANNSNSKAYDFIEMALRFSPSNGNLMTYKAMLKFDLTGEFDEKLFLSAIDNDPTIVWAYYYGSFCAASESQHMRIKHYASVNQDPRISALIEVMKTNLARADMMKIRLNAVEKLFNINNAIKSISLDDSLVLQN